MKEQDEEKLLQAVATQIGYGRIMQLASKLWRENLRERYPRTEGGEFAIGPCVSMLVPCLCEETELSSRACDWCCGTGRVTKRVRQAQEAEPKPFA